MFPKDRAIELTRQCLEKMDRSDCSSILEDVEAKRQRVKIQQLCRLWAGMGSIYKFSVGETLEFVVKHVTPPPPGKQSFGDRRKSKSYQVEANYYKHVAPELLSPPPTSPPNCLVMPTPYVVEYGPNDDEITICMSYLQGSWIQTGSREDVQGTLRWLAHFHAAYWGLGTIDELVERVGLQEIGSYWHLDTRPDEHAGMSKRGWQGRLKLAAKALDECLKRDPMQCLIHGDPKEANVMKLNSEGKISMYDFQYCGKGTPTRDLAYFLCSSCDEDWEDELVNYYFAQLKDQLNRQGITPPTLDHFQQSLNLAFCDFYRFLCGWGQWGYDLKDKVLTLLQRLDDGKDLGSEEAYQEAMKDKFW